MNTIDINGCIVKYANGSTRGILTHEKKQCSISWDGGRTLIYAGEELGGWRDYIVHEDQDICFTLADGRKICLQKD